MVAVGAESYLCYDLEYNLPINEIIVIGIDLYSTLISVDYLF